ncbi:MAG: FecR domain-containing protein [Tannerella sp.]|jgi:ferric-dicitrate binding protein FerR (iron transport regulator)|nr:FecR domain-containing protein [Tannerella sp.]
MKTDRDMLVRYFLGRCSEEEKEAIRLWLADGANRRTFVRERIRFDAAVVMNGAGDAARRPVHTALTLPHMLRAAAAILLLLAGGYFFSRPHRAVPPVVPAVQSVRVPPGSRAFLVLPDSSSVWLNSNSTLRYPGAFGGGMRTVELDGEAFFDVARREGQPFVVKTGRYCVEATGTSFDVEAYAGRPDFSTALFSGRIRLYGVQGDGAPLGLEPGEMAVLTDSVLRVLPLGGNRARWREGLIVIEDNTFEEIMRMLEKYFDRQIVVASSEVRALSYRGKFRIADGVEHALRVLQKDFRFAYRCDDDSNIIHIY